VAPLSRVTSANVRRPGLADLIEEAVLARVRGADVVVHLEPTGVHRSTHE
jgi:hypothetical protein